MQYLLAPLAKQYDLGFGITAEAFRGSAERLRDLEKERHSMNPNLPIGFLYRHAIELFLKSVIIVFYKRFDIKNSDGTSEEPKLQRNGNLISIFRVHDIAALFSFWMPLFTARTEWLKSNTRVPPEIPSDIPALVAAVDAIDRRAMFWRYPVSDDSARDETKYESQSSSLDELHRKASSGERVFSFLITDGASNVSAAFEIQSEVLSDEIQRMHELAEFLSTLHTALRCELCNGW